MALVQAGTAGVRSLGRAPPPHGASRLGRGAAGQGPAAAACARVLMRAGPRPPVLAVRRAGPLAGGCVRTNRMYDRRGLLTV